MSGRLAWRLVGVLAALVLVCSVKPVLAGPAEQRGRATFLDRCALCHGEDADGHGPVGATLPLKPRNFRREPLQWGNSLRSVVDTVKHGRQGVMPSFQEVLSPSELADVAAYVWSIIPAEQKKKSAQAPKPQAAQARVFLIHQKNKLFTPTAVTARVGDTLVFVNEDEVEHEVHALDDTTSPPIQSQKPRQWDRVELTTAGTLRFGCAIHPAMRLEVKVEPAAGRPDGAIEVRQKGQQFSPAEVTVPVGRSITFVNDDDVAHSVFSKEGGFELPVQRPGERAPVTFDTPGTVEVRCAIHPGMKLKVKVK
ncbi:MAG: c-type cytochrome [Myxococcaceae bacterium]|nr:c-type cytochrome [Myxococcaceae bacterium]